MIKKVLFVTGTRADYGKMKSLMNALEINKNFEIFIFVSGMHLIKRYGNTYNEILKDNYKNIYLAYGTIQTASMSYNIGNIICNLTEYVQHIEPDMIIVHGDRIDAFAGAIVGALNNVRVAHIEGGEVSGTIDESIRHSISKLAHLHFVANEEAKRRLLQMGENQQRIYVIGSPDIDIMISNKLPTFLDAKEKYNILFSDYAIFMYHPITTDFEKIGEKIKIIVDAMINSQMNYIIIYPNNDTGNEIILNEYKRLKDNKRFKIFPSIRFEYFLILLKNAQFMMGNSSAGIRETSVYGIPSIDIGDRQCGRYNTKIQRNIVSIDENYDQILKAIKSVDKHRIKSKTFGNGNSTAKFLSIIEMDEIWKFSIQKKFFDMY